MFRALTSGDLRGLSTGLFLFYFLLVLFFYFLFISCPVLRSLLMSGEDGAAGRG